MHTSIAPALSPSFSVIAERFRRAGQIDRAIALCREGLEAFPDHLSARVTLGCALLEMGQHLDAHRELQAVLKRAPDNLAAIRGLAELHARGIDEQDAHDMQEAHDAQFLSEGETLDVEPEAPEILGMAEIPETPETLETPPLVEMPAAYERLAVEAAPAPAIYGAPLALAALAADEALYDAPQAPEVAAVSATAAVEPVTSATSVEHIDPIAPVVFEDLDLVSPVAAERIGAEVLSLPELDGPLALDDLDPIVLPEPLHFEIEDVLPENEDAFELVDAVDDSLDIDPPVAPQSAAAPAEPIPVPALTDGPIAVLDEWLTRVRARRSELLSEYAAS